MIEKDNKKQEKVDESAELTYQQKIEGQLECLREMNKILKGVVKRYEATRNNNQYND
jgi:translation initiation factor 2B subunit (eIF-2B alpha/beta/delta family)